MIFCKCDGCGKEAMAASNRRELLKPTGWLERRNIVENQGDPIFLHACSKTCIEKIEEKLKTGELRNSVID